LHHRGIEIGAVIAHIVEMDADTTQLKRNRAKVFMIAAVLFFVGSQGPDLGDLFDDGGHHRARHEEHFEAKIDKIIAKIEQAAERAERKGSGFSLKIEF
jgi:hypothetical protein